MSKLMDYFNSDSIEKNDLYVLKLGTSVGTWVLVFFHIVPMLAVAGKYLFVIFHQERPTSSGFVDIFLYYILNPIIATIIVKWQNHKLVNKTVKFRKIYVVVISFIVLTFALFRISSLFFFKT